MARTILVIDDNPLVRDVLRSILESRGYMVLVAPEGESGLRTYADHHVDVALVDVDMPRMDGVEVCRGLHSLAKTGGRSLRVWLMTGVRQPDVVARALAVGACDVLAKPFTTDELITCFESEIRDQVTVST